MVSGFYIFHDKDYVQDKTNNEEHKRAVLDRLKRKVNHAISNNEPLLCIGYQLPEFSLSDLGIISKEFTKSVYFNNSQFFGKAEFSEAKFHRGAFFGDTNFQETQFFDTEFYGEAIFRAANFQGKAYFYGAKFKVEVQFADANFQEEANFSMTNFQGKSNFGALFSGAKFHGEAYFAGAKFQGAYFFEAKFHGEAYFRDATFQGEAELRANFQSEADFSNSEFYSKAYFSGQFNGRTEFNYVLFERKEKVIIDIENLSNISFMNTDITGVRFSDKARWGNVEYDKFWGGKKVKEERFKIIDERQLEKKINEQDSHTTKDFNLGSIKAVYRSLRENYEYRMRYDEAGQFFIREMELKRMYREVVSSNEEEDETSLGIKRNYWFRRNLFSLTGWYYHLSRYGESLWRPTLAGLVIVFLSTLFWLIQINPSAEPSFTNTVGFANATKITVWQRAFERSMVDFLPLLSIGGEVKVGLIDYIIKIVGGAVTFGLIAIALRRRFERRYRH
ncbi:MAG TPA: pentapeptide repeat-containing protein [Nitrososphaeraceae archaeon]|nr:pentapeptide repeat-containing protein [Nitrososphaeraceae archaeon]